MSGGRVFDESAEALAPFGRIVAYGIAGREQNTLETGRLMRKSRAVIGFWLVHCLGRREMIEEPLADLFDRAARGDLKPQMGRPTRSPTSAARTRTCSGAGPAGSSCWTPLGSLHGTPMTKFADLGLSESTLEALAHLGYDQPTPIQEQAIPPLLEGRDVIGQAQTGTGKTAAFGLPMVEYVDPDDPGVQALVLTPTRELCIQVTQALRAYGERKGARRRGGVRRRADPRPGRPPQGGPRSWWAPSGG